MKSALLRLGPLSIRFVVMLGLAAALPLAAEAVTVNCSAGQTIKQALALSGGGAGPKQLVITVSGICTENVLVTRDDVTINTNGVAPATITAQDANLPAIQFEGSRRIVIDGGTPGITVNGGTFGISATRGAAVDVRNCVVTSTSRTGLIASYGSSLVVDNCTITGNANGASAVNSSSLVVTNSIVSSNTQAGLIAARNAYIRVGQDAGRAVVVSPVTVSGNGTNGIAIAEGSAGNVVGGIIETSGTTNLFIGRASSGQIGIGTNGLTGGVTIQNGSRDGVGVEGGNATIVFSTISGNARRGISVSNAGSARIGILNDGSAYGPNLISGNGSAGIQVSWSGGAFIGGTIVRGNGTDPGTNLGRYGINIPHASATLVGNNLIENNAETGVFASAGHVFIGDAGFSLVPTTNTITNNGIGVTPTNNGGIYAFEGSVIRVNDATINNNLAPAVQAFESGSIELRGNTTVTVPAPGPGALVQFGSTLRLRDNASIVSAGDGIQASNRTA